MTVSELIEILQEQDPEANVLIMSQQSWPFENRLRGVCTREELGEEDESGGKSLTDVFLVEGSQIRYGNKVAWDVT